MYFRFNPIHNVCERVDVCYFGMAMVQCWNKNQQENFAGVTLQILPLYFMKFSAKLIVLKSYCETSLSTTTVTTTLSTASSVDIVMLVCIFLHCYRIIYVYTICMCLLVQFLICLFTIYTTFFM